MSGLTSAAPAAFLLGGALIAAIQRSPVPSGALGCLGLVLLSLLSFFILKTRSFLKQSGNGKPDFTSLRSTGKTIVNAAPPDEDDPDQFRGGVN